MPVLKTLDVAIGIALLYAVVTFAASALVELISMTLNWRAEMLHDAIRNMLLPGALIDVREVYGSSLITALGRGEAARSKIDLFEPFGWRINRHTPPSYIPAATFSSVMIELLIKKSPQPQELSPEGAIRAIRNLLEHAPCSCEGDGNCEYGALGAILMTTLAIQGTSIQAVRLAIEKWFNDTMDRVSGWYKRRTQACLLLLGLVIGFGANVTTISAARWLWRNDAARQVVLSAAAEYAKQVQLPPGSKDSRNGSQGPPSDLAQFATQVVELDRQVSSLQFPFGWPPAILGNFWLLEYIVGALLTAIAVSLGSAFWFDALQNLIRIRGTGPKPSSR